MAAARGASSARWGMIRALGLALRAATRPGAPGMGERLTALPRMVRAALRGEYVGITRGRLLGMLGALLYIVSPVDLVPEGLFAVFGLADKALMVTWLATSLVNDTEAYLLWERGLSGGATSASSGPQDARTDERTTPADATQHWTVQSHVVR